MFCYKCGKENDNSSAFCEGCGAELVNKEKIDSIKKGKSKSKLDTLNTAGEIGAEVAKKSVKTVSKGVKVARRVAIFSVIIALALGILNYYFTYMVESPDKVVQKAMAAKEKNDIKTLVSCFDPQFQQKFNIAFKMTGGVLNSLIGANLDWSTLFDATSAFSDYLDMPVAKCHPTNYAVTSITGEKLKAFVNKFGTKIESIGNALGSEATVAFDVDNTEECRLTDDQGNGTKMRYSIVVKKYDKSWLIPIVEDQKPKFISSHN